ncbi:starch-binding protein [Bacteroidia bacterium]|nr:starch-binding protein [Bacteroidia bacterium]
MKRNKLNKFLLFAWTGFLSLSIVSCDDYLDREPSSAITPEKYLWNDAQLSAYAMDNYQILPTHGTGDHLYEWGTFATDANTDVMIDGNSMNNRYIPGEWKVPTDNGDWSFGRIVQLNYFINTVIPRYEAGELQGNLANCKHYIGEIYFFRAFEYFSKLRDLGDFPIIDVNLPDNMDVLIAASKRAPRNEVARHILADVDKAIEFLSVNAPDGNKNRVNRACAYLLKSRVALYEGTWEKYFKGTAFVPGGPGWPGASKDYNAGFTIDIDAEIAYFLGEAMTAAAAVADDTSFPLTPNNWKETDVTNDKNQYFTMFSDVDMKKYSEVLLWRQFKQDLVTNNVNVYATSNNKNVGLSRVMVESFLMKDGLPFYKSADYKGDNDIKDVKINRDPRLQIFLKVPGQTNALTNLDVGTHGFTVEPIPDIKIADSEKKYATGYTISKGMNYDFGNNRNGNSANGSIVFRATEAYLNYIEAAYEKNGSLDAKAQAYWVKIRERAGMDTDFQKTIDNTDMSKEVNNWGSWSAGQQVDKTLYNIRRERSVELLAEAQRYSDVRRWRSLDQLIGNYYHFEGFKVWSPVIAPWYNFKPINYNGSPISTVSSPALSDYFRPHEKSTTSLAYPGATWVMAHYLTPIAFEHFLVASVGNGVPEGTEVDYSSSPIYQNPGWPIEASAGPIQ